MNKKLKKLTCALKEKGKTLALAESCSGGYASYLLTKIPGASEVFKGAVVVYSLETKNKFFGIPSSLLKKTQGVSKEVALKLAIRVRKKFNADIGASVVGFAGPSTTLRASTEQSRSADPRTKNGVKVGTTFIAYSSKNRKEAKKIIIKGSRDIIRKKASSLLIDFIYQKLNTQYSRLNT
ncbi:MAG: CinA family protein [Candidatus Omnitrophica bacterium]|nr:CinA family protein [Candidatus Omnitrophota bacterium]